jgi:hypothetical protein
VFPDFQVQDIIITFDYLETPPDDSVVADAQVVLSGPGGTFTFGGRDNPGLYPWFVGNDSSGPNAFTHTEDGLTPFSSAGTWDITFTNDWANDPNPNDYGDLTVTFVGIPAPGALALLGVAGLVGAGRRRRAWVIVDLTFEPGRPTDGLVSFWGASFLSGTLLARRDSSRSRTSGRDNTLNAATANPGKYKIK